MCGIQVFVWISDWGLIWIRFKAQGHVLGRDDAGSHGDGFGPISQRLLGAYGAILRSKSLYILDLITCSGFGLFSLDPPLLGVYMLYPCLSLNVILFGSPTTSSSECFRFFVVALT